MITITTIEQVFAIYHVIKYQGALGSIVESGGVRVRVLHFYIKYSKQSTRPALKCTIIRGPGLAGLPVGSQTLLHSPGYN